MTTVEVKCVAKKEAINYNPSFPVRWEIELEVPYDQNSIFWKMSGGTNLPLNTINKEAADQFVIGEMYVVTIDKKENI